MSSLTLAALVWLLAGSGAGALVDDDAVAPLELELRIGFSDVRTDASGTPCVTRGVPIAAFAMIANVTAEREERARIDQMHAEREAAVREGRSPDLSGLTQARQGEAPVVLPDSELGWMGFTSLSIQKIEPDRTGGEILVPWLSDAQLREDVILSRQLGFASSAPAAASSGSSFPVTISPDLSGQLQEGDYVFRCDFDSRNCGQVGAWAGELEPAEFRFRVVPPSGTTTMEDSISRASFYYYRRDYPRVVTELAWADEGSESVVRIPALKMRARAFELSGDKVRALDDLRFMKAHWPRAFTPPGRPPNRETRDLARLEAEVAAMESDG